MLRREQGSELAGEQAPVGQPGRDRPSGPRSSFWIGRRLARSMITLPVAQYGTSQLEPELSRQVPGDHLAVADGASGRRIGHSHSG
ncbi:MAG: hypothetical protein ACRDRN_16165 [Sciscionella sp.]